MKNNISLLLSIVCIVVSGFFVAESIGHKDSNSSLKIRLDSVQLELKNLSVVDSLNDYKFKVYSDSIKQIKNILGNAIIEQHVKTESINKQVINLRRKFDATIIERPEF